VRKATKSFKKKTLFSFGGMYTVSMMVGVEPDNLQTADSNELDTGTDMGKTFHFL